jgi:uncharacterized protein
MMKTSLDHLPASKQRELQRVVEILFAEFQDAIALGTQPHKRMGRILHVVLFGSYARGDWVDDPVGGYVSDYDLLVVVNHDQLTDVVDYWAKAEDHLLRELTISHRLTAPVNFIVHTLADVNNQLSLGRPFFTDILRDGVSLYELSGNPFVQPQPVTATDALVEARGNFEKWLPSAVNYRTLAADAVARDMPNEAAFLLHQAAERVLHGLLLVTGGYSPKSHNLKFLRSLAEDKDRRLIAAWPRSTKFDRRRFELLKRAYVEARYSPHYEITAEELAWLAERVAVLLDLIKTACQERLADLARAAES